MGGFQPGTIPAVLAAVWALLIAGYLATAEFEIPDEAGQPREQTLLEAGGVPAAVLILAPVAIAGGPFALPAPQRRVGRIGAAVLLTVVWLLAPALLAPYVPAIVLLVVAGLRTPAPEG